MVKAISVEVSNCNQHVTLGLEDASKNCLNGAFAVISMMGRQLCGTSRHSFLEASACPRAMPSDKTVGKPDLRGNIMVTAERQRNWKDQIVPKAFCLAHCTHNTSLNHR